MAKNMPFCQIVINNFVLYFHNGVSLCSPDEINSIGVQHLHCCYRLMVN